jgi:hypothetical protein
MIGLGVQGDSPPSTNQPPLPDGIHLRWSFEQELGFPWYGYYLFRRLNQIGNPICLSAETDAFSKGVWPDKVLNTLNGQLSSDANLVLTDDFSPTGRVEFDLRGRGYLRFDLPSSEPANRIDVQIGFRKSVSSPSLLGKQATCVNFNAFPPGAGPNPRIEQHVQFEVQATPGARQSHTQIDLRHLASGATTGLNCGFQLDITLPVPCSFVELTLSHNISPPKIETFDADGSSADSVQLQTPPNQLETVRIKGKALTRVVVFSPRLEVWLHNFCFGPSDGPLSEIKITALLNETVVASTTAVGQPGQVVPASLEFDAITAIEISPGAAALVDVCFWPVSQDATRGWGLVPGFRYPMCLPVMHPDYPCSGGAPVNETAAEALALSRVRYGPAAYWSPGFVGPQGLHATLLDLVVGGPASTPMAVRSKPVQADLSATDGIAGAPDMPSQRPLDLVLLGALHPPVAQMLGLYWVDDSVAPNQSYDYLIVADYKGIDGRDPKRVLGLIATSGFGQLDGYIVFNKRLAPAAPLPAPSDPRVYVLPGGSFPQEDGSLPEGQNNAALRWDLDGADVEVLQSDKPIMYHVWRAELGDAKDPAMDGIHNLITENRPVLVTEPRVPPGAVVQRAADWPPFPLLFIDPFLIDGWYSYQVSGIDIFGRYTTNSKTAVWYQWQPMPNPRPWYYQDPPGDAAIREDAVRLRDTTPPPPPTGIEANALDPADPTVVRDDLYQTWLASLDDTEQERLIGLRVKWLWTRAHQQQAPDAREFRIYFHPGSPLPLPEHSEAINWQERYYVVAYDDPLALRDVDVDGKGTRHYEIILPTAADEFRGGLTLEPSLTEPVVYAHISISTADDKIHTSDAAKWAAGRWGDRFGNEGRVGAPSMIYRVLRTPPDAPAVPPDSEKVFATKADYYSRSFYTYRWSPMALLKAHIFRAMDDTIFKTDWSTRPRPALAESQVDLFPDETIEPRWNAGKRQQVADKLNQVNTFAHDDAGTAAALTYYRGLSNDALRILAGLPDNDRAFSQLTINPLDPDDPANANRRGPDNDDSFVVDPALRAYVDTLDGRATNQYFYRAIYVDGAHNRSQFSLSGPPVYLPKVVPPRPPVVAKALGGELQVTLRWAANREPDLAAYRVYRTDREENARDVRLMDLVAMITQANINLSDPDVEWIDEANLIGGRKMYYRLVAEDSVGNESEPTRVYMVTPVDARVPPAPVWTEQTWLLYRKTDDSFIDWPAGGVIPPDYEPVLRLKWRSETPEPEFVITHLLPEGRIWTDLTNATVQQNPTDQREFVLLDFDADPTSDITYRLKVRSSSGVWSTEESILSVTPPEAT